MKTAKIHIRRSSDGQYYFTLNAKNGKVRTTSEMYKEKRKAVAAIEGLALDFGLHPKWDAINNFHAGLFIPIIDHTNP